MTRVAPAVWAGVLLLALPVLGAAAFVATAPDARPQGPTAFSAGAENLTLARRAAADLGYPVAALASDLAMARGSGLIVVPEPTGPILARHAEALERHLARGGSVWVAGGGALAPWLAQRGAAIGTQPLLQAGSATGEVLLAGGLGGERFERVASALPGTILVEAGHGWQAWLEAPASAHIDLDADGRIGQADPPGPFPVGVVQRQDSGGRLIVTADASLLGDAALQRTDRDNGALWQAVLADVAPEEVLFDESQHGWSAREAPLAQAARALQAVAALPAWMLLAGLAVLLLGLGCLAAATPALRDHAPHHATDPAAPADVGPHASQDVLDVAWDLLARRTGRPLAELRAAGPDAARGLAEDPALRRVLLGNGSTQDQRHVLSSSLDPSETRP